MTTAVRPTISGSREWTPDEDAMLIRGYKRGEVKELAASMHRSLDSVYHRAYRLKLKLKTTVGTPRKYWTPEDVDWLEENAERYSMGELCRRLGRTRQSIQTRLHILHISRAHREGWYTLTDVTSILGATQNTVLKWLKAGVLRGHKREAPDAAFTPGNIWEVSEPNLKMFIREHMAELTGNSLDLAAILTMFGVDPIPRK